MLFWGYDMNDFKKERKKLEQTGFSGQTLEQALKLMEETEYHVC